jgi:hypothetical protein
MEHVHMSKFVGSRVWVGAFVALAWVPLVSGSATAQVLYAASGSNGVDGTLYTLNPATGAVVTTVGALRNAAGTAFYGLTGMAYDPVGDVLYGSTSNASATAPGSLVRIDRSTGIVTEVGSFSILSTMADISFQPGTGVLFGWQAGSTHSLFTINTATGAATAVGAPIGSGLFGGGGLAFRPDGTLYSAPEGGQAHTLRTVNPSTGVHTIVGVISGGFTDVVSAMDFNGSTLIGVFTDQGVPTITHLGSINTATGAATDFGLINAGDIDALAFVTPIPEPTSLILSGVGLAGLAGYWRKRRSRS